MEQEQIQFGQEYRFDFDDRYFIQTAERAMKGDVVRGVVELITNSDDSYGRLEEKGGKTESIIKLSVERKRKNSIIKVLDYAEGMTLNEMLTKLKRVGGKTSGFFEAKVPRLVRGAHGRGAKECVVFGTLQFESIKDGRYSNIELRKPCTFIPIAERDATAVDRFELEIPKNGTLVTLCVEKRFKVPIYKSFFSNLPRYYSLRDIVSNRKLILVNANTEKENILFYKEPQGKMVFDEEITVPDYPQDVAHAHVVIKRADNRIPIDSKSSYWEGGFIVKSNHAIHGITSLSHDIENNHYFEYYFGRITCPYIDELFYEYEECEKNKQSHTSNNPVRIMDPLRDEGLFSEHPFTKALYSEIAKHVRNILKKHEEEVGHRSREVENEQTKKRHQKLGRAVGKFFKEEVEDLESYEDENYLGNADIPAGGMRIVPEGLKVPINKTKKVYIYVKPIAQQEDKHVLISVESDSIKVNSDIVRLIDRGDGILTNSVSFTGIQVANDIKVKLVWNNVVKFISVSVVIQEQQPPSLTEFQFEKQNYTVKEGKEKKLTIVAQWPEFIHGKVTLKINMAHNEYCELAHDTIALDYDRTSSEKYGKKFATGVVKVKGIKAGGHVTISAILQNKEITAKIRVAPQEKFGQPFEIKLVDEEELGTEQRAFLMGNIMKINGRHKVMQRYLGPREKWDDTQNSMHVRLLIAELVADTVVRRILESRSQKNSSEYNDMDVTRFYKEHRQYTEKFLEIAHYIQIPNHDI